MRRIVYRFLPEIVYGLLFVALLDKLPPTGRNLLILTVVFALGFASGRMYRMLLDQNSSGYTWARRLALTKKAVAWYTRQCPYNTRWAREAYGVPFTGEAEYVCRAVAKFHCGQRMALVQIPISKSCQSHADTWQWIWICACPSCDRAQFGDGSYRRVRGSILPIPNFVAKPCTPVPPLTDA